MWHETWELLIAGLGSAIAIVIATFAIIQAKSSETQADSAKIQTNILKEQFESSHRPWIGGADGTGVTLLSNPLRVRFTYKNFGGVLQFHLLKEGK